MENIYLDKYIAIDTIRSTINKLFPSLVPFHYDFDCNTPEGFDASMPNHIFFNVAHHPKRKEFSFDISIFGMPRKNIEERQLHIGKEMSKLHQGRILVPFTLSQDPYNPYYDIVFENGKSYLVDDSDSSFSDESNKLIKIIREYPLPRFEFNSHGELIAYGCKQPI